MPSPGSSSRPRPLFPPPGLSIARSRSRWRFSPPLRPCLVKKLVVNFRFHPPFHSTRAGWPRLHSPGAWRHPPAPASSSHLSLRRIPPRSTWLQPSLAIQPAADKATRCLLPWQPRCACRSPERRRPVAGRVPDGPIPHDLTGNCTIPNNGPLPPPGQRLFVENCSSCPSCRRSGIPTERQSLHALPATSGSLPRLAPRWKRVPGDMRFPAWSPRWNGGSTSGAMWMLGSHSMRRTWSGNDSP